MTLIQRNTSEGMFETNKQMHRIITREKPVFTLTSTMRNFKKRYLL